MSDAPATPAPPAPSAPSAPSAPKMGTIVMVEQDRLYEYAVLSKIRLEYLKLAIIVVLILIIVWYIYRKIYVNCAPAVPAERLTAAPPAQNSLDQYALDDAEHIVPYASWLVPSVYNSGAEHDTSVKPHYGQFAPLNTSYLQPHEQPREHLQVIKQHGTASSIAGERNVPEMQLQTEAGLLFGLSNYDDTAVNL